MGQLTAIYHHKLQNLSGQFLMHQCNLELAFFICSIFSFSDTTNYVSMESNKVGNDCRMTRTTEPLESLFDFKRVKNGLWDTREGVLDVYFCLSPTFLDPKRNSSELPTH